MSLFKFSSLKYQFMSIIGVVVFISLFLVSATVYYFGSEIVLTAGRELNISRGNDFKYILNGEYNVLMEKVDGISQMNDIVNAKSLDEAAVAIANSYHFYDEYFSVLAVMDLDGIRISNTFQKIDNSDREYFSKVKASKKEYISEVLISRGSGKLSIVLVSPWQNAQEEMVGMVYAVTGLDTIQTSVENVKIGDTGYAFLLDAKGLMLAHGKNKDLIGKVKLTDAESNLPVKSLWEEANNTKKVVTGEYVFEGVKKAVSVIPLELLGGELLVYGG